MLENRPPYNDVYIEVASHSHDFTTTGGGEMELFAYLKRAPSPGTSVRYLVNTDDPDTAYIIQGHVLVFTEDNWDTGAQVTVKGVYQTDYQRNMTQYLYDGNGAQVLDRYVLIILLHS